MDPVQREPSVQVLQRRPEGLCPHVGCFHRRREAEGAGSGCGRRAGHQGGHVRPARAEGQRAGPRRRARAAFLEIISFPKKLRREADMVRMVLLCGWR